ncbi:hypothetical protein PHLCEN_2v9445 [Hermanssonia centrifuga]|uniref:Uncharacterized protein n=2 Tax=Hermanssonia centrifuga TaxID=98765 RepID=A0A2R6NRG6_9APHY|nr:hypothetical protein PHLCEN_2v9445 [Hermanssonia centrifuga]
MASGNAAQLYFCNDISSMDEWAKRTGIPLTTADALGTPYRRARDWIVRIRNELVGTHGWRDVVPLDSRILFDIEMPYPYRSEGGIPLRPNLRLRLPAHASTFFDPERRVQWEMVFHSNIFHLLRHTVRPITDLLYLLQCLLTGMLVLVMEDLPGQGGLRTIRALPPSDWVAAHEPELVKIFGHTHFRLLLRAAQDTRVAFKVEAAPRR